jgi:hypothetical protein
MSGNKLPFEPTAENKRLFTLGLMADVVRVISEHGFPLGDSLSNKDHSRVLLALYRLLFGEEG